MRCPVCKTECWQQLFCSNCGFDQLQVIFINRDEAEYWRNYVVEPYRQNYERSNPLSQVERLFNDCKKEYESKERQKQVESSEEIPLSERHRVASIEEYNKLPLDRIKYLQIPHEYKGELPDLTKCGNLSHFHSFSSAFPLAKYADLNHTQIRSLFMAGISDKSDITVSAPILEELYISIHDYDFNVAKIKKPIPIQWKLDLSGAGSIKQLELSYLSGFDISSVGNLENLEYLRIYNTYLEDFSWLKKCVNLKKLQIESCGPLDISTIPSLSNLVELSLCSCHISSLESLPLLPGLKKLDLYGNDIEEIHKVDNIRHIGSVDLSRNPISSKIGIPGLIRKRLILNETDRRLRRIFTNAYEQTIYRIQNKDTLSPFVQKLVDQSTPIQMFVDWINSGFADYFLSQRPNDITHGIKVEHYCPDLKSKILEYIESEYPFIHIDDRCRKQVHLEQLGIQHFFKPGAGNILFVNSGVFYISIKPLPGAQNTRLDIQTFQKRPSVKWNDVLKYLNTKEDSFIVNQAYHITIVDLYGTGEAQRLSMGIRAAFETIRRNITLPSNTFIFGEYSAAKKFKKDKISEYWIDLAGQNGAERILAITGGKRECKKIGNVTVQYGADFNDLHA